MSMETVRTIQYACEYPIMSKEKLSRRKWGFVKPQDHVVAMRMAATQKCGLSFLSHTGAGGD